MVLLSSRRFRRAVFCFVDAIIPGENETNMKFLKKKNYFLSFIQISFLRL